MKEGMEIYIQGLRSLRDAQTVCIGKKLTFLVGPNSAGKSTVLLALQKLEEEGLEFQPDLDNLYKNPRGDEIAQLQMLGIGYRDTAGIHHASTSAHFFSSHGGYTLFGRSKKTDARKDADTRTESEFEEFINSTTVLSKNKPITFAGDDDRIECTSTRKTFSNKSLISTTHNGYPNEMGKRVKPGIAEPPKQEQINRAFLFQKYEEEFMRKTGAILIRRTENNSHTVKKIESALKDLESLGWTDSSALLPDKETLIINKFTLYEEIDKFIKKNNLQGRHIQNLKNKIELIYSAFKKISIKDSNIFQKGIKPVKTSAINASRTVPQKDDLHLLFGKEQGRYQDIFESAVLRVWEPELMPREDANKLLIDKINNALSGDLFIDNGYQILVSADFLLKRDQIVFDQDDSSGGHEFFFEDSAYGETTSAEISKPIFEESTFLCEIRLKDAHGKELKFSDVGSGIGYVFPILYEIFRAANKDHIIFIQQPELHLHPAMQANLTDTLIRATSDRRIIAETHSEHMILRALKRVRQTTNGTLTDPELALTPEDVAINYFEPQGDGSTRVHNIRVSADGDFLDKWPKGFFAERDQELFDE